MRKSYLAPEAVPMEMEESKITGNSTHNITLKCEETSGDADGAYSKQSSTSLWEDDE